MVSFLKRRKSMKDGHELSEASAATDKAHETAAGANGQEAADHRIQRLQDLLADALGEPDPLRANLRAAAADLLEIAYRLGAGIKGTMSAAGPDDPEGYEQVMPAINSMATIHRQATRYIQLDRDWASGEDSP
jgi:hypothetical protein